MTRKTAISVTTTIYMVLLPLWIVFSVLSNLFTKGALTNWPNSFSTPVVIALIQSSVSILLACLAYPYLLKRIVSFSVGSGEPLPPSGDTDSSDSLDDPEFVDILSSSSSSSSSRSSTQEQQKQQQQQQQQQHETKQADLHRWRLALFIGFCQFLGTYTSILSLRTMSLDVTHVIKALEPVFTLLLSSWVLNIKYSNKMWIALAPIIAGIFIASGGDQSANAADSKLVGTVSIFQNISNFLPALLSNLAFALRNVVVKLCLEAFERREKRRPAPSAPSRVPLLQTSNQIVIFASSNLYSILFCIAIVVFQMINNPSIPAPAPSVIEFGQIQCSSVWYLVQLLSCSLFHALYHLLSFLVLAHISAVAFSVANVVKRIVLITSSWLPIFNLGDAGSASGLTLRRAVGAAITMVGFVIFNIVQLREPPVKREDTSRQLPLFVFEPFSKAHRLTFRVILYRMMKWIVIVGTLLLIAVDKYALESAALSRASELGAPVL